ncbi:putative atp-dependent rna helicase dbp6 protein [Eutypa lata UCREL1]|uniref:ATP-dependent RNA helicase n=1 Tax=Eutypa lata (strain UCR-EL1) TaxID=1287681 RepID=M7SV12_EUTLA|nr:putative atp-dependent rna helicase dbp6 protein [Eutypa lata UCREL1]
MYARYVPPPKSNTQSAGSRHIVFNGNELNHEDEPPAKKVKITQNGEPKKEKKDKKNKKAKAKVADDDAPDHNEPEPVPVPDVEPKISDLQDGIVNGESSSAQPSEAAQEALPERKKEKKAKKKKLKENNEVEEDDTPIRHKSVLRKAAKAMQRPSESTAETAENQDDVMQDAPRLDEKTDEVTELHGLEPLPQPEPVDIDTSRPAVRIGTSMGSQTLQKEQSTLVEREEQYDPAGYAQRLKRLAEAGEDDDEDLGYNTEDEEKAELRRREDRLSTLPDHVISYKPKVDILICTPGRLVEHINYTPGFSLEYVRWLIVDEADKLLSQNFQQWLDIVIPRLQNDGVPGARNHKQSNLSGIRKVILSATMTRDLDRLGGLKLRRPKLVVLEGAGRRDDIDGDHSKEEHALPELLEEAALKVSDPNLKPLFLLDLLQSALVLGNHIPTHSKTGQLGDDTSSSGSSTSSSDPDTDSDSESASDSDSNSDSESSSAHQKPTSSLLPSPPPKPITNNSILPSILIFTRSNETAIRLSRLLALMSPTFLGPLIGTLTSTTPYARRKATLRAFTASDRRLRILVASDLVARGVDLPALDHVINYDMPASVASYVHRVGRTARAGRGGHAWTLYTVAEARWFWRVVAGEEKGEAGMVRRARKVERVRVTEEKGDDKEAFEEKVGSYESALERLGREADRARRGKGNANGKGVQGGV